MLKDCDFFKFQSEKTENKTGENEAKKNKEKEAENKKEETKEKNGTNEKKNEENASKQTQEKLPLNSSINSILDFLVKKNKSFKSDDKPKMNKFLVKELLENPEDHSEKKANFHYKIKNLTKFFHPKKSLTRKIFRKISKKIEKDLRYNDFPNIYNEMIGTMEELIQSFPPKIEHVEKEIPKSIFEGVQPESEKLPANEETILPFTDLEEVTKVLHRQNQNPFYEILPLSIDFL